MRLFFLISLIVSVVQAGSPKVAESKPIIQDTLWVDVRTPGEYEQDHLDSAINIPLQIIPSHFAQIIPDTAAVIGLYCRSGNRSGMALQMVQQMNYQNAFNAGGYGDLKNKRK